MKATKAIVIIVAALLATTSIADAKECSKPSKPAIPDGKTASDEAMKAAQSKVAAYITGINGYLHCMAEEMNTGKEEARQVSDDWKKQSDIFVHTPKQQ